MKKTIYIPIDTTIDNLVECTKLIKRGDTLTLIIKVFTNGILADLTGQSIDLILKKADNSLIQKVITSVANGIITATLDVQSTNVPGLVNGEMQISDTNGQSSTNTFTFNVDSSLADDVIAESVNDIQVLNDMKATITQYINYVTDVINAGNSIEALENIKDYTDINLPALENENAEAVSNKSKLDASITSATAIKKGLDASITSGNTVKSDLDLSKANVNTLNDALITTIGNADDKLKEFKDYDTTNLVPISNTMLNDMYCNKELLSINHELNGYPIVQLVYTKYGAGVGGAGDFPVSADSECNLMQNKTVYTDNNNFTIYVPENYYIAMPTVQKVNDYKYVVTFENSTRSILIQLKEMI